MSQTEILGTIPHRPPFLFLDSIDECSGDSITCSQRFQPDAAFYGGHYPGNPITPGVLLCESVFQAGAVLLSRKMEADGGAPRNRTPVLCRIEDARFKSIVRPGDSLTIQASLRERLQDFYFLNGKVLRDGKAVLLIRFALTLAADNPASTEK
ncbi:MAG: beta-hydroxyacyl-ACP dehydratase [Puniceicoccales bacterium]|jgi:3-hydroxyacyl-[acyl-carrier-protein] dehydratase|nr:beta-hydroxyacyl-ACP dehydratase [Puniceicoccales bacterium]